MAVLILSSPEDPHASAVEGHLVAKKVPVHYWRSTTALAHPGFKFELTGDSTRLCLPTGAGKEIDLSGISCIWLRRPGKISVGNFSAPWVEAVVRSEATRALAGIYRALPVRWVNDPGRQDEACLKVRQLDVARRAGLGVPATLITNDPQAVRSFFDSCDGQVVYKLIDETSVGLFPAHEAPRGIPTLPLREQDLKHLDQVRLSLHFFQRRINKAYDLRVTIIGDKVFAVRIDSQQGQGRLDWRLDYSVPMSIYRLPDEVAGGCLEAMRMLGLTFAAFDLCRDIEGRYVFFEANPAGQFLWLEERLGLPLSYELACVLAGGAMPPAGE